jgi:hypothetical protein
MKDILLRLLVFFCLCLLLSPDVFAQENLIVSAPYQHPAIKKLIEEGYLAKETPGGEANSIGGDLNKDKIADSVFCYFKDIESVNLDGIEIVTKKIVLVFLSTPSGYFLADSSSKIWGIDEHSAAFSIQNGDLDLQFSIVGSQIYNDYLYSFNFLENRMRLTGFLYEMYTRGIDDPLQQEYSSLDYDLVTGHLYCKYDDVEKKYVYKLPNPLPDWTHSYCTEEGAVESLINSIEKGRLGSKRVTNPKKKKKPVGKKKRASPTPNKKSRP